MKKMRIDQLLVERGLADSHSKAHALVMAGIVLVNDQRVEKPSQTFAENVAVRLKTNHERLKYVGRGGLKLEKALNSFHIRPDGYECLDIGASTGGFTDCLLQNGAKRVFAVDAGTNQLDWKLRNDKRVETRENTNARNLKPDDFEAKFDLIVMDVSFISATKILPVLKDLINERGKIIVLIKPQFEVEKNDVESGGLVTNPEKHKEVIKKVNTCAESAGLRFREIIDSPILGMEGNKEFLALYERAK